MKTYKFSRGRWIEVQKELPEERSIVVYLNGDELVTLSSTPGSDEELVVGFLFTEGIICGLSDISRLEIDSTGNVWVETTSEVSLSEAKRKILTSGCGKGVSLKMNLKGLKKVRKKTTIAPEEITEFVRKCQETAEMYRKSGGIHSAAVLGSDNTFFLKEDIGRHNALDKAIGSYLLRGSGEIISVFATGRLSSEMVSKAIRAGAEFCLSLSSPTDAAVILAEKYNVTVVGYIRGKTFTIYTHPERIIK